MTISSQTRKTSPFIGNGVTTALPFAFKVFTSADVYLVQLNTATDVESVLVEGTDYTISLNANQNANPGGTATLSAALPTGKNVVVTSDIALLQATDLTNNGAFYPEVINDALDRLTIITQQIQEQVSRAPKVPITSAEDVAQLVSDVNILADHADDLHTVALISDDVQAVAAISAEVQTVADNVADVTNFSDVYYGASVSDPSTRKDGSALEEGDLYFNTSAHKMRTFSGTVWVDSTSIVPDASVTTAKLASDVKSKFQDQTFTAFATAGTPPAFTVTTSPAYGALAANQRMRIKFDASGTTGSNTLNRDGLGVKNIKQYSSTGAKVSAIIVSGMLSDVEYDGTDFVILQPLPTASVPAGVVCYFAKTTPPTGFFECNGAAVSRSVYSELFAVIGTTFGTGDGTTTFNLPELRAEHVRGWDNSRGVDSGRAFGSAQLDAFQGHIHSSTVSVFANTTGGGLGFSGTDNRSFRTLNQIMTTAATDGTNGTPRVEAETRGRNVALLACIKY